MSEASQQVGLDREGCWGRWGRLAQLRTFAGQRARLRTFAPSIGMICFQPELLLGGRHAGRVAGGYLGIWVGVGCGWCWSRVCHQQVQGKRATGQERWVSRLAPSKHLTDPDATETVLVAGGVECFG